jgi:hypothetical protein
MNMRARIRAITVRQGIVGSEDVFTVHAPSFANIDLAREEVILFVLVSR